MKKTIRLTESELVKLVQRIIKEDEMMGTTSTETAPPRGYVMASMKELLRGSKNVSWNDKTTSNDFDYYSKNKYLFTVISGQVYEQSPGGISPIRRFNNVNKVIFMKEGGTAEIEFIQEKGSRGDGYTLICRGGKITISPSSSVGP
jgi:hypothetical protein